MKLYTTARDVYFSDVNVLPDVSVMGSNAAAVIDWDVSVAGSNANQPLVRTNTMKSDEEQRTERFLFFRFSWRSCLMRMGTLLEARRAVMHLEAFRSQTRSFGGLWEVREWK